MGRLGKGIELLLSKLHWTFGVAREAFGGEPRRVPWAIASMAWNWISCKVYF